MSGSIRKVRDFGERTDKTMEEKKNANQAPEISDEALDMVSGGIKRQNGMVRSTYCSTCGKNVTPDDYGCCPDCGKQL